MLVGVVCAGGSALSTAFPTFDECAATMAKLGYAPLPIKRGEKKPAVIKNWTSYTYCATDPEQYRGAGIGILTKRTPVIDNDVRNAQCAAEIEAIVESDFGPAPRRIGQAPKAAYVLQLEGDPFAKVQTRSYRFRGDAPAEKSHKVEVLADGQQLVCYNIHQDTHRPYVWNGHGEPLTVPADLLPTISAERARAFIAKAELILAKYGEPFATLKHADSARAATSNDEQRASDPRQLREALSHIRNADLDYDDWVHVGHALKGALGEDGREDFLNWSAQSAKDNPDETLAKWHSFNPTRIGAGSIYFLATNAGWQRSTRSTTRDELPPLEIYEDLVRDEYLDQPSEAPEQERKSVTVADFYAYMPTHQYIFVPSRELWPGSSVNKRCESPKNADGSIVTKKVRQEKKGGEVEFKEVPMTPAEWIDEHHAADQMTWMPGEPMIIEDRLVSGGGWIVREGCRCFNLYRAPNPILGNAEQATRWLEHVHCVFPDDAEHIIKWLAHRVQRPGEKINHAIVLSGEQGIGKDTLLEPVKSAIGAWNFQETSPKQLTGRFNGFLKSVILRVSEARDLGEVDRYAFYEHMKVYCAAPPDVLLCDEKNLREHSVPNVCGVVITTNHSGGNSIYLPAGDRRHYVAWSDKTQNDFPEGYWRGINAWYDAGGAGHVAAYLATLNLSGFDPKAPPPKTPAFWEIVHANRAPEDAEIADALDKLGNPDAVTLAMIDNPLTDPDFRGWLKDRRNSRQIPHRLDSAGYAPVRNGAAEDGLWRLNGKRQAIYGRKALSARDRIAAAAALCMEGRR